MYKSVELILHLQYLLIFYFVENCSAILELISKNVSVMLTI